MNDRIILLVTWRDAVSNHVGWAKTADVHKQQCPVVHSVGFELRRTKRHLTLISSVMEDECSGDLSIPLGMIIREEILQPGPTIKAR
jgi:hypothetical protein